MAKVEARSWSLTELFGEVRGGRLRVPAFQRGFIWRRDQLLGLFDSIARGYPIGTLLVWTTRQRYASRLQVGPISVTGDAPPEPTPVGYVLDGHQRVSALLGALDMSEDEAAAARGSARAFLVCADLDAAPLSGEVFCTPRRPEVHHLPVRLLLREDNALNAWIDERRDQTLAGTTDRKTWDRRREAAQNLQRIFAVARIHYLDLKDAPLDEAVNVFIRLNNTATPVRASELFAALSWDPNGFDFAEAADAALKRTPTFATFGHTPLLRALLATLGVSIYTTDWPKVLTASAKILPGRMRDIEEAWVRATALINELIGASSGKVVPYALQLVALTVYCHDLGAAPATGHDELKRWLWATSLSGAYTGGGGLNFDEVVRAARELAAGRSGVMDTRRLSLSPLPRSFHPKSSRVRAFHLFLKELGPLELDGRPFQGDPLLDGMRGAGVPSTWTLDRLGEERSSSTARTPRVTNRLAARLLLGPASLRRLEELAAQPAIRGLSTRPAPEVLASHGIPPEAWERLEAGALGDFLDLREQELARLEREHARRFGLDVLDDLPLIDDTEPEVDVDDEEPARLG
jgi:hypothetical protein